MASQPAPDRGNYIETFTGRRFFPKSPRSEDVAIQDIAHSLALQCRYNGHCRRFYSVAEHSLSLAYYTAEHLQGSPRDVLFALLHDAAEAYTSDLPRPTKLMLPEFKALERQIESVVWPTFGLPPEMPKWLHEIDNRILRNERDELMADTDNHWDTNVFEPLPVQIRCLSPEEAEKKFLDLANDLLDIIQVEGDHSNIDPLDDAASWRRANKEICSSFSPQPIGVEQAARPDGTNEPARESSTLRTRSFWCSTGYKRIAQTNHFTIYEREELDYNGRPKNDDFVAVETASHRFAYGSHYHTPVRDWVRRQEVKLLGGSDEGLIETTFVDVVGTQDVPDMTCDIPPKAGSDDPFRLQPGAQTEFMTKPTCSADDANPKDLIGCKKPAIHLVPPALVLQAAEALKNGARKYGPYNWREKGVQASIYVSACMRHLASWWDGEQVADDSGVHHLAHAAACLAIILDAESIGKLKDDRPLAGAAADFIRDHTEE